MKRALFGLLAAWGLASCISTGTIEPRQYFVLEDAGRAAAPRADRLDSTLLVAGNASDAFYESRSLAYSREPGQRAYYQFASWTDQPARRLALLVERRLEARASFRSVSPIDSGAGGDLLLTVTVDEILHDDADPPGTARIEVTAELLGRRGRSIVDRRRFVATAPVTAEDAPGAVAAMNRAATEVVDAIVAWAEDAAARLPARSPR